MSNRYTILFSRKDELYTEGSPVFIAAGALLKDNVTGKTLAQLKMRSVHPKTIKAVSVRFFAKDTAERPLGEPVAYSYLDLHISRDEEFGQNTAIPLPDSTTRAFSVEITEVVFTDGELWTPAEGAVWTTPKGIKPLAMNEEMKKQYRLEICKDAGCTFSEELGLWYCGCGAVNLVGADVCHLCGTGYDKQKNVDLTLLKKHCEERLAKEEAERKAKEEAERIEAERRAEEERIAAKKRKKIIAITTPIVVACIAFLIVLTTVIIPSSKYNSAMELYNANNYEDAYKAFNSLSYKDSAEKAAECLFLKQNVGLTNVSVGSTIKFGFYEQDNSTSNGKEEIEWIVLAIEGNKALIISQYALDCKPYNNTYTDTTWEKCTLRTWLNGTFYEAAFDADHQKMIVSSTVTADKNPSYSTSPGNNTTDKVFLLSITEVNKYFSSDEARKCASTEYAKAQGAYTRSSYSVGGKATCWWWLRSPGRDSVYAASVLGGGSVRNFGNNVSDDDDAVRPALWINLAS